MKILKTWTLTTLLLVSSVTFGKDTAMWNLNEVSDPEAAKKQLVAAFKENRWADDEKILTAFFLGHAAFLQAKKGGQLEWVKPEFRCSLYGIREKKENCTTVPENNAYEYLWMTSNDVKGEISWDHFWRLLEAGGFKFPVQDTEEQSLLEVVNSLRTLTAESKEEFQAELDGILSKISQLELNDKNNKTLAVVMRVAVSDMKKELNDVVKGNFTPQLNSQLDNYLNVRFRELSSAIADNTLKLNGLLRGLESLTITVADHTVQIGNLESGQKALTEKVDKLDVSVVDLEKPVLYNLVHWVWGQEVVDVYAKNRAVVYTTFWLLIALLAVFIGWWGYKNRQKVRSEVLTLQRVLFGYTKKVKIDGLTRQTKVKGLTEEVGELKEKHDDDAAETEKKIKALQEKLEYVREISIKAVVAVTKSVEIKIPKISNDLYGTKNAAKWEVMYSGKEFRVQSYRIKGDADNMHRLINVYTHRDKTIDCVCRLLVHRLDLETVIKLAVIEGRVRSKEQFTFSSSLKVVK